MTSHPLGNLQTYFDGYHPNEHRCRCYDTDSCLNDGASEERCNCDARLPLWSEDSGVINSKDVLPITGVTYGPLTFELEQANFTIGPLRCSGKMTSLIYITIKEFSKRDSF